MSDKKCTTNKTNLKKKQQGGKAVQETGPINKGTKSGRRN